MELNIRMSDSKFLRGTLLLSIATFISKFLGMIYIFPFAAMVGQQGIALYQYGYQPYTLMLSVATLGIPMAMSKFVSKYNAMGDFETGRRLFKSGLFFMTLTGIAAFLILFFGAPLIVNLISFDSSEAFTSDDIVFTIRMVSFALMIIPTMAIMRGFFQGHQSMGPTAVSQVIEQIVRIVFILAMALFILYAVDGNLGTAIGFATFGAFVGGLASMAVLIFYWKKRQRFLQQEQEESTVSSDLALTSMYSELIRYALPLSFVGLAIPLFQMVDMFTFTRALEQTGEWTSGQIQTAYGAFAGSSHKLILIPVAIATAMSITLIPTITKSFTGNDQDLLQRQITQTYQVILFLSVPAAVGLSLLAKPTFGVLFGTESLEIGSYVLQHYAYAAIVFSLFSVSAAVLQGINRQKYAIASLLLGLLVKIISAYILLLLLGPVGGIYSTIIGFACGVIFNAWAIAKFTGFHFGGVSRRAGTVVLLSAVMGIGVLITRNGMEILFTGNGWIDLFMVEIISVGVGGVLFMALAMKSGLAEKVLGKRFAA